MHPPLMQVSLLALIATFGSPTPPAADVSRVGAIAAAVLDRKPTSPLILDSTSVRQVAGVNGVMLDSLALLVRGVATLGDAGGNAACRTNVAHPCVLIRVRAATFTAATATATIALGWAALPATCGEQQLEYTVTISGGRHTVSGRREIRHDECAPPGSELDG